MAFVFFIYYFSVKLSFVTCLFLIPHIIYISLSRDNKRNTLLTESFRRIGADLLSCCIFSFTGHSYDIFAVAFPQVHHEFIIGVILICHCVYTCDPKV